MFWNAAIADALDVFADVLARCHENRGDEKYDCGEPVVELEYQVVDVISLGLQLEVLGDDLERLQHVGGLKKYIHKCIVAVTCLSVAVQ